MTKLETVRALNDSGPQLQIVESVRTLQRSIEQLQSMPQQLEQLPDAIAQIMGPMTASTEAMAERVDKLTSAQREAIQQCVAQMQGETIRALREPMIALNKELDSIRVSAAVLSGNLDPARLAVAELKKQAQALARERAAMQEAGQALSEAAKRAKGSPFMRLLGLLTVGIVSAAATLTGVHVLGPRLDDTARAAAQMRHIMTVATDAEVELLRQIVRRPAP